MRSPITWTSTAEDLGTSACPAALPTAAALLARADPWPTVARHFEPTPGGAVGDTVKGFPWAESSLPSAAGIHEAMGAARHSAPSPGGPPHTARRSRGHMSACILHEAGRSREAGTGLPLTINALLARCMACAGSMTSARNMTCLDHKTCATSAGKHGMLMPVPLRSAPRLARRSVAVYVPAWHRSRAAPAPLALHSRAAWALLARRLREDAAELGSRTLAALRSGANWPRR